MERAISLINRNSKNVNNILDCPSFSGVYNDDYDIIVVHKKLLRYLSSLKNLIPDLNKELHLLDDKLKQQNLSFNDRRIINNKITFITNKKNDIINDIKLNTYKAETKSVINKYLEAIHKCDYIEEYLCIASKYCNVNVVRKQEISIRLCTFCGNDISLQLPDITGLIECNICNNVLINKLVTKTLEDNHHRDTQIVQPVQNDIINKLIDNYQGLEKDFDGSVIVAIHEYFKKNNIYNSSDKLIINKDTGKANGTSVIMMVNILKTIGFKKYSKNVYYICKICWGWKLNDLSDIETDIINKYNIIRTRFEERYTRKKAANSYWFYRILLELGVKCDYDDFNLPKSYDCKRTLSSMWDNLNKE